MREQLSDRETECLRLTSDGKTSEEIGLILGISKHTADTHFRKTMRKLGVSTRTHAVATALRAGLIS